MFLKRWTNLNIFLKMLRQESLEGRLPMLFKCRLMKSLPEDSSLSLDKLEGQLQLTVFVTVHS